MSTVENKQHGKSVLRQNPTTTSHHLHGDQEYDKLNAAKSVLDKTDQGTLTSTENVETALQKVRDKLKSETKNAPDRKTATTLLDMAELVGVIQETVVEKDLGDRLSQIAIDAQKAAEEQHLKDAALTMKSANVKGRPLTDVWAKDITPLIRLTIYSKKFRRLVADLIIVSRRILLRTVKDPDSGAHLGSLIEKHYVEKPSVAVDGDDSQRLEKQSNLNGKSEVPEDSSKGFPTRDFDSWVDTQEKNKTRTDTNQKDWVENPLHQQSDDRDFDRRESRDTGRNWRDDEERNQGLRGDRDFDRRESRNTEVRNFGRDQDVDERDYDRRKSRDTGRDWRDDEGRNQGLREDRDFDRRESRDTGRDWKDDEGRNQGLREDRDFDRRAPRDTGGEWTRNISSSDRDQSTIPIGEGEFDRRESRDTGRDWRDDDRRNQGLRDDRDFDRRESRDTGRDRRDDKQRNYDRDQDVPEFSRKQLNDLDKKGQTQFPVGERDFDRRESRDIPEVSRKQLNELDKQGQTQIPVGERDFDRRESRDTGRPGLQEDRGLKSHLADNAKRNWKDEEGKTQVPVKEDEIEALINDLIDLYAQLNSDRKAHAGVRMLFELADALVAQVQSASKDMSAKKPYTKKLQEHTADLIATFTGRKSLELFLDKMRTLANDIYHDKEANSYLTKFRGFLLEKQKSPETSEQFRVRARDLIDQGRSIVDRMNNKQEVDDFLTAADHLLENFKNDELVSALTEKAGILRQDFITEDSQGNRKLDTALIMNIQQVIIPVLADALKYIPIPRISNDDENMTFSAKNIIISGYDIVPENIHAHMEADAWYNVAELETRNAHTTLVMELMNIRMEIKDIEFMFKKKKFPRISDAGFVTIRVRGRGASLKIRLDIDQRFEDAVPLFKNADVDFDISTLDIDFDRRSIKHSFLLPFFTKVFKVQIKRAIEKSVEEKLAPAISMIGSKLSESLNNEKFTRQMDRMKSTWRGAGTHQVLQKRHEKLSY